MKEADMPDIRLEVDIIPVSDVERSKQFYGRLGWRLDDDVAPAFFAFNDPDGNAWIVQEVTTRHPGRD